jgi:hypothetical protein
MKSGLLSAVCGCSFAFIAAAPNAALITTNSISNPTIVDFSTQPTLVNVSGPIQIGGLIGEDITVSGDPNTGLFTNDNLWNLGMNGFWGGGMTYVGANDAAPGSLIFSFNDGPVSAVGGFMNHVPEQGTDLIITALDAGMNVLETYNITALANIVTPEGFNDGAFRGIQRGVSDISLFEVTGFVPVLDDLTFSRTVVPVPPAVWFFGSGLLGLIGLARRKKAA